MSKYRCCGGLGRDRFQSAHHVRSNASLAVFSCCLVAGLDCIASIGLYLTSRLGAVVASFSLVYGLVFVEARLFWWSSFYVMYFLVLQLESV